MKYIKLFENWLNEAEVERKFSPIKPQSTPVLETTIENLYHGGELDINVLSSVIRRSAQKSGDEFQKNAGEDITLKVFSPKPMSMQNDPIKDGFKKYINFLKAHFKRADVNKDDFIVLTLKRDSEYLVILPKDLSQYKGDVKENCSNLPILICQVNSITEWYSGFLGQILMHTQKNLAKSQITSIYSEEENYKGPIAEIFAGETKASNLAFDATIAGIKFLAIATPDEEPKSESGIPGEIVVVADKEKTMYLGQIKFDFDKSSLKEDAKKTLEDKDLRIKLSDAKQSIEIIGYTDGKGSDSYNQKLSEERAKSVLEYLKTLSWYKKLDVVPTTKGMGSKNQIKDDNKGTDPINSSINRRVEFIIDGAKADYSQILNDAEKMRK
jgi:outer membrane protein OmpA-like peptidoglycan-associated protein